MAFGRPHMIYPHDFDVPPMVTSDLNIADIKGLKFMQTNFLSEIIGDISDLSRRSRSVQPIDVLSLQTALSNWLRNLPEELRLYDFMGQRNPYNQHANELHCLYFVGIILTQALTKSYNKQWRVSLPSVVASSGVARLYEEIYYREDASYLLPIHGFLSMVAAVPLLFYQPQSKTREDCRQEELGIICSIVKQLRRKFGGADTVLKNIESLKTERDARDARNIYDANTCAPEDAYAGDLQKIIDLFPFPPDLCPAMEMLNTNKSVHDTYLFEDSLQLGADLPEWLFGDNQLFFDVGANDGHGP
jgi:hypothetical protein